MRINQKKPRKKHFYEDFPPIICRRDQGLTNGQNAENNQIFILFIDSYHIIFPYLSFTSTTVKMYDILDIKIPCQFLVQKRNYNLL